MISAILALAGRSAGLAAVVVLAACQSSANMQWTQIGPGPTLQYAEAQCNIGAMGVERGVIAWGSPSYVAGAQIGNAIGNAIRQAEFKKNCMVMQGWKQVPVGNVPTVNAAKTGGGSAADLILAWGNANKLCTENSAGNASECAKRSDLERGLNAQGFCYGADNQSATPYWRVCPTSPGTSA